MSSKTNQKRSSSAIQGCSKYSKILYKDDLNNNNNIEINQAVQERLPYFQNIFKQLIKMGLPMLEVQPNQELIKITKRSGINNLNYLQRLISVKLEGQPMSYRICKLTQICKSFLKSTINKYQNFDQEQMLGLINSSVEVVRMQTISWVNQNDVDIGQNFDYQNFLNLLDIQKVFKNAENLSFISTDIKGYYEMKDIKSLRDHGNVETFQKVRKLRLLIFQILKSIKNIIDSLLEEQDIDTIEEAFIQYLDLKQNLEFPFTEDNNQKQELDTSLQLNQQDLFSESSASPNLSFKSVKFHSPLVNSEIYQKKDKPTIISSILKNGNLSDQQYKNRQTIIKQKHSSYQQISKFDEIIDEIPESNQNTSIQKKKKKNTVIQKWDLLQQNQFEKIFNQTEQTCPKILNQDQEPSKPVKQKKSNKQKKQKILLKQMKRKVYFDLFDSHRFYNGKILDIKPINPKNPFFKYPFINYQIDSEEEQAEDLQSENRSQESSRSNSLQEFIVADYKNQYQIQGETYNLIIDNSNFEHFLPYQAIMLSHNRPQISSKKQISFDSDFNSNSSLVDSQNEKQINVLTQLQQFLNTEQIKKVQQIYELETLETFQIDSLSENQNDQ